MALQFAPGNARRLGVDLDAILLAIAAQEFLDHAASGWMISTPSSGLAWMVSRMVWMASLRG